ncbi:MAG: rRNA maturation RNase YbeY [Methylophilaceae bacterium]|jgi:probable rRNA maturation factor|nr:rRNA maturation RNase YbeY [Methylophilaceae bacterium]
MNIQNASEMAGIPSPAQFKKWARKALRVNSEITLRIVDEEEGRMLNLEYRGKDYATNVLTFPLMEEPFIMADIVICAPVVAKEAQAQHKTLEAHFAHLMVHGILHAHGYDHEVPEQAELMESVETQTLTNLGYADPYMDQD